MLYSMLGMTKPHLMSHMLLKVNLKFSGFLAFNDRVKILTRYVFELLSTLVQNPETLIDVALKLFRVDGGQRIVHP